MSARTLLGRRLPLLAALATCAAAAQAQEAPPLEPLPWQDAAPLALPFLQLPMEGPATLPPGRLLVSLRTIHSSSIAHVDGAPVTLDYQLGVTQPSLVLRAGLRDGLELHAELAAAWVHDDYLSPLIRRVEAWFGGERQLRRESPSLAPRFTLVRPDGRGARFAGPQTAVGDAWAGLKGRLRPQEGLLPELSWRAALKLPVGRFPYGSGVLEGGAGLLAAATAGAHHAWLAADLLVPFGPASSARLETRPHPAFQLAVAEELGPHVALLLQGSAHGSAVRYIHLSEIDGWSFYVLGGLRVRAHNGLSAGVGLVENLLVTERGTDLAALFDLWWRP